MSSRIVERPRQIQKFVSCDEETGRGSRPRRQGVGEAVNGEVGKLLSRQLRLEVGAPTWQALFQLRDILDCDETAKRLIIAEK